jgi:hypothetical protein
MKVDGCRKSFVVTGYTQLESVDELAPTGTRSTLYNNCWHNNLGARNTIYSFLLGDVKIIETTVNCLYTYRNGKFNIILQGNPHRFTLFSGTKWAGSSCTPLQKNRCPANKGKSKGTRESPFQWRWTPQIRTITTDSTPNTEQVSKPHCLRKQTRVRIQPTVHFTLLHQDQLWHLNRHDPDLSGHEKHQSYATGHRGKKTPAAPWLRRTITE